MPKRHAVGGWRGAEVDKRLRATPRLEGEITPPGDKSISHRAVLLNSIASGRATISNFSFGDDCLATINCLRALGVRIEERLPSLEVYGVGFGGLKEASDVLNAANSGTTMRLLAGLLAAQPFLSIITGDASLRSRPMGRVIQPLRLMGAEVWGRERDTLPPLVIRGGKLRGVEYSLPVASAQLKSALLIAALFAQGKTAIKEPASSRDHTERMLRAMGARLETRELEIALYPSAEALKPLNIQIPGDLSSAAYWLVAGAIHSQARVKVIGCGINPTRSGLLEALQAMGARLRIENRREEGGESVADLIVESSKLRGIELGGKIIPRLIDEIPVLAVAACVAQGTTVIKDASELRVKETDRISHTVSELTKMGARAEELPDGMVIKGGGRLRGAEVDSHGDHRLAMTLGVAALVAQGETILQDAECVKISYPDFWQDFDRLSGH